MPTQGKAVRRLATLCVLLTIGSAVAGRGADDVQRALDAVRARARAGDVVAQFSLGSLLYYGGADVAQAVDWFRKAANGRHAPAEFQMGQLYEFGLGVPQNDRLALEWYRKAADDGSAAAQRAIGRLYWTGRGVPADAAEAARWYRAAAEGGDLRAQYHLADSHLTGTGVAVDNGAAYLWFSLAAVQAPLPDNRDGLIELRNIAAARMTDSDIAAAASRVATWQSRPPALAVEPDVMFVPTPPAVVDAMLEGARVGPTDVVYDLGSGDGRVVIAAARKYGARGVGIELDPVLVKASTENAAAAGVSDRVRFVHQNLFTADISDATVVTLYLLQSINERLRPKLVRDLKPGTRVVSHVFNMGPEWPPEKSLAVNGSRISFWTVAAR